MSVKLSHWKVHTTIPYTHGHQLHSAEFKAEKTAIVNALGNCWNASTVYGYSAAGGGALFEHNQKLEGKKNLSINF